MSTTMSTSTESSSQTLSPFSSPSVSELTTDEHPDLGQFSFVFHTLTHLQPQSHPWFNRLYPDDDAPDTPDGSTVWQQLPILSYLDSRTPSELIVPRVWTPTPLPSASPGQSEDEDDTEGARTVDIASSDGDELDVSIGDASPDSHSEPDEEINPDDRDAIPPMWHSPMRIPLRAYSPAWDSEQNADEFGPFDGATTASSGTRPTEDSLYRDAAGTPSSIQDGSRTSPPNSLPSFPAHDDNSDTYSLLERPASLPAEYRQSNHVFSSPFNDNSTRSSYSETSSPPQIAHFLLQSPEPDISHQHGHGVQPHNFIPHDHHHQRRRWNSGSGSTSTVTSASATTRATHAVHDPTPDITSTGLSDSRPGSTSDLEGSDSLMDDESIPSLGLLEEALKFIAEERAKWEANLSGSVSSDSERWRNELGSDSTKSASDLMLLSPDSQLKTRKKNKTRKTITGPVSGAETPVVSILRSDGSIVGGGRSLDAGRKKPSLETDGVSGSGTLTPRVDETPKKKANDKGLVHSRSVPQLKIVTDPEAASAQAQVTASGTATVRAKGKHANANIANAQTHAVNTKRARLQNLAKQLQGLFPQDKARLEHVLKSLEKQKKEKKHKASESSGEERIVLEDEEEDLDPRGRPLRKGDPLVHVFIDHSNILFGLLAHLKRHPPRRPLPPTPSITSAPASPAGTEPTSIPSASTVLPLPSFATARARIPPPPPPPETDHDTSAAPQADNTLAKTKRRVRHLSHAALSLILERGRPVTRRVLVTSSPLYQPMDGMERLGYQVSVFLRVPDLGTAMDRTEHRHHNRDRHSQQQQQHSSRATLTRSHTHSGASKSPRKHRSGSGSGSGSGIVAISKSPRKSRSRSHARPRPLSGDLFHFGGGEGSFSVAKDAGEPASAPSSYGTPAGALLHGAMHARAGAGNSAVMGGAAGSSSHTSTGASAAAAGTGIDSGGTPHRIRFREQGVDELLQLKLHQALAAEDDVPEGATIVLATGDGNVGQFNEEGFLGPVRTALKRGWKVELYSWEGGLSRAWKREFGHDSEWGKKGKFRVIGMEQFASSLVEDGWVEV